MSKNILVTGSAGFIGFHLCKKLIENGEYQKIIFWLKNNIHIYGRSVNSMELVRAVTNEELSPNYFINYLSSKLNDFC